MSWNEIALHCCIRVHNHLKKDSHYLSKDFGGFTWGFGKLHGGLEGHIGGLRSHKGVWVVTWKVRRV